MSDEISITIPMARRFSWYVGLALGTLAMAGEWGKEREEYRWAERDEAELSRLLAEAREERKHTKLVKKLEG